MLRRNEHFDLDVSRTRVKDFINRLIMLNADEQKFLQRFKSKEYLPGLLFDDSNIVDRIKNHPMALWKNRQRTTSQNIPRNIE